MNRNARSLRRWTVAVLAGAGIISVAALAHADTTPTQTATVDLGDLDESGDGTFDAFDPSLGTLTQVDITVETTMSFEVCIHNRSGESDSVPSGEATGEAPIVFPADVVSNATGSVDIPATDLAASDGGDDCTAWLGGGAEPSTADSVLFSASGVDPFSATLTDPADLAEYIGPGTIPFTWTASSDSSIGQPSEWTIVFLADGAAVLTINYTYEPAGGTTTTTGPPPTSEPPPPTSEPCVPPTTTPGQTTEPGAPPTTNPCAPPTTEPCVPPTTTPGAPPTTDPCAPPGTLPTTGGGDSSVPMLAIAGLLLLLGSGLVYTAGRRGF